MVIIIILAVKNKFFKYHTLIYISVKKVYYLGRNKILDRDEVDDKQQDILDCLNTGDVYIYRGVDIKE